MKRAIFKNIPALFLVMAIILSVIATPAMAAASTGTVTRSFSSANVAPGATVTVTLTPAPAATFDLPGYQVVETVPAGFTVTANTAAIASNAGNVWTFTNIGSAAFTYTVTAPAAAAVGTFSGTFKDDASDTGTVAGPATVTVSVATPAPTAAPAGAVRVYITSDNPAAKPSWDAQSFGGFFYDIKYNRKTETLAITRTMAELEASRTINKNELVYTTGKANVDFKVFEKEGKKVLGEQSYPVVGWMAEKWVAVKGKANKLAKLTYEMDKEDKKTLTTGETWVLGAGYELTINALDARTTPRQVWFTLKKDGAVVDEGISDEKNVFTKTMTIQGESDALLFTVYVDRIFSGSTSDMAQFKYAWLIDGSTAMEVKSADKFGPFEVRTATSDNIMLDNENSVSLSKNSETTVLGNIKFIIADSDELRFYPDVKYTAPGKYETRGYVYNRPDNAAAKPTWNAQTFAGFFYDIKYNRKTETLSITRTMAELEASRTINKNELVYTTGKANVDFKVFEKEGKKVLGEQSYPVVGWMAEKWVAVKGKANKLAKLTYEMNKEDKKTLTTGETWVLGAGYELTINALDARTTPRQVWFTLKKDGAVVDEGISDEKNVFTKTMTIQGESDALLFTVYVDRIFSGSTSDMAQFKYAWLIDGSTAMEVKSADKFGPFEVRTATADTIMMDNENSVSLSKNSETTVLGNIKFVIADADELRFYPKVDYVIGGEIVPVTTTGPKVTTTGTAKPTATVAGTAVATPVMTTPAMTEIPAATTAKPAETTPTEPGFEAVFAIAGLLAVAFLVLRQRK